MSQALDNSNRPTPARRRSWWLLAFIAAAAVFDGAGIANYLTTVLWLGRDQHTQQALLGVLASVATMVYVSTVIGLGSVADKVGVRRMTCTGALIMALANVLMALGTTRWLLVVGMMLKGLAAATFWPALSSWMGRGAPPSVLAKRVAAYNLGWCGGQLVGLAAAGWLYELVGGLPSFGVYAAFNLALAGAVWWLPDPAKVSASAPDQPAEPSRRADRLCAWLSNFAGYFALFEVRVHFSDQASRVLHLSEGVIGLANASVALVQVTVFYLLGLRVPHLARGQLLVPALVLCLVGFVAAAALGGWWLLLCLPTVGFLAGVSNSASLYHSVSGRTDAARQSGIHETVLGVAMIVGPILGGQAAQHFGLAATWWLGTLVIACALVAVLAILRAAAVRQRDNARL